MTALQKQILKLMHKVEVAHQQYLESAVLISSVHDAQVLA